MTATLSSQISPAVAIELAFRLRVLGNAYFSVHAAPDSDSVAEFQRLFKDPLTMPCPPWQSASDAPEGAGLRLMGPSARQALAWYQRYGFQGVNETDQADHIGYLLTFAGVLLESGADPDTLQHYAHDHLHWIPAYCERLGAAARTPFYRELAEETRLAALNFIG
jgi:TorA maturation chaperone TorD